jgi:hypothetical protein
MKKAWALTAAVVAWGWLTGATQAQDRRGGAPVPGAGPQAPGGPGANPFVLRAFPGPGGGGRQDRDKKDGPGYGWIGHVPHVVPHGGSGGAPLKVPPEAARFKPPVGSPVPAGFRLRVPAAVPEAVAHVPVPRPGWFRLGFSGKGILAGLGGGLAALFGALFGRKKD